MSQLSIGRMSATFFVPRETISHVAPTKKPLSYAENKIMVSSDGKPSLSAATILIEYSTA